jgi:hypothetical protein
MTDSTDSKEFHERALEGQDRLPSQTGALEKRNIGDIEITPREWESFLDSFSLLHEGWLASLSVVHGPEASIEVSNCRLQSIALDCANEKCRVNISVIQAGKQRIHSISDPSHLIFKQDSAGAHQGLDIASADDSVTLLRFRAAARPETLDGILPDLDHCMLSRTLQEFGR